jgi:hypothetical protein
LFVATGSATATTAQVNLRASIRDVSAVTNDPATDGHPGDISKALVTFVDRDNNNNPIVGCSNLPVTLNSTATTTIGTAGCTFTGTVGTSGATQYTIGIVVSRYYSGNNSADDTVVTVSQASASGMISGGGLMVLDNTTSGLLNPQVGSNNNFGFNVKYNKSGTNLQGNINTIVRSAYDLNGQQCATSHPGYTTCVYQIKGNQLAGLAVSQLVNSKWAAGCSGATMASPCKANFGGKANVQDITNPSLLVPVSASGNSSIQAVMTDYGTAATPQYPDTITFNVSNSAGVWFSTAPSPKQVALTGGNLVVH